MNRAYWVLPSAGFVFLVVSLSGALAFAIWGFAEPRLSTAWELENQLRAGLRERISAHERRELEQVYKQYPGAAQELLGDKPATVLTPHVGNRFDGKSAYLLVAAEQPLALALRCRDCGATETLKVRKQGAGKSETIQLHGQETTKVALDTASTPRIVELRWGKASREGSDKTKRRALELNLEVPK